VFDAAVAITEVLSAIVAAIIGLLLYNLIPWMRLKSFRHKPFRPVSIQLHEEEDDEENDVRELLRANKEGGADTEVDIGGEWTPQGEEQPTQQFNHNLVFKTIFCLFTIGIAIAVTVRERERIFKRFTG